MLLNGIGIFSCFKCTLHFKEYFGNPYPFGGAYLAVEFFFLVSGFFLMKTISETHERNAETATIMFAKTLVSPISSVYCFMDHIGGILCFDTTLGYNQGTYDQLY